MGVYPLAMFAATLLAASPALALQAKSYVRVPVPKNAESWIAPADYPAEARKARRTGKAEFRLRVDRDGEVETCDIIESSGHRDLDHATCLKISERALFEPARNTRGRAIAGTYQSAVRWQLPEQQ